MDILKKIFNFNKVNKNSKELENGSNKNINENIEVNNIQKIATIKSKNDMINKLVIWKEALVKNNIEDMYIQRLILKISNLINSNNLDFGEKEIIELNQEVDNIIKREKIKNKKEMGIKIQSSEKLNSEIKELINLLNEFNETENIEGINIDINYENFLSSQNYLYTKKIEDIINKVNQNQLNVGLYKDLGGMYKDYEVQAKNVFKQIGDLEKDINIIIKQIETFAYEVKDFTVYVNKINAKGKIELKNQYEKLQRGREVLLNKEKIYKEQEERLNNKIIILNKKISHILIGFKEILEYIQIFMEEQLDEIQIKISTFTKEKSVLSDKENMKYEIYILTELRDILKN